MMEIRLNATDQLTEKVKSLGINTWSGLITWTKNLPYGRNANRHDLILIVSEKKGTCSSKHAFLKKLADLNEIENVNLIIGIYKMNNTNTPKIGDELTKNSLDYIPEAHCYLEIEDVKKDYTNNTADFSKIKNDILKEINIQPEQVANFKVEFHKSFIKNWIIENDIRFSFDEIWKIRENCIQNLSKR